MASNLCQYAKGTGGSQYRCSILARSCPFQHWCTNNRIYELTSAALKCATKIQREKEKQL